MNFALILSGGIGARMNMPGMPKQYINVNGKPIIIYTLERFEQSQKIDNIIVVANDKWQSQILAWANQFNIKKILAFASPGEIRQSSILNGLNKCMEYAKSDSDLVIIHDAVRPMVSVKLIDECLDGASENGGCMPVLPVVDTIYQSSNGHLISNLLDRRSLFAGQSPEAFFLKTYTDLNNSIPLEELNKYNGTSEIAFNYGIKVKLISGEDSNFKITTFQDLERFRTAITREKE